MGIENRNRKTETGIPSKIASGTYYVWYRVEGDNYYNAKNNYDPITVEILEPDIGDRHSEREQRKCKTLLRIGRL